MDQDKKKKYVYKIVLLGESGVGKTSLALRFVKNDFNSHHETTIGAAFLTKTVHLSSDFLKFEIWDTAGQERYHSLTPMYYRGAHAAIVVFDMTNTDSYQRAKIWVEELRTYTNGIVIILAGNKCDQMWIVPNEEVKQYAQKQNIMFMTTSAKECINVTELFMTLAHSLPRNKNNLEKSPLSMSSSSRKCCS